MLSPAAASEHTKDSLAALAIRCIANARRGASLSHEEDTTAVVAPRLHLLKSRAHSAASVNIHVRDLSQMFSSLDPRPSGIGISIATPPSSSRTSSATNGPLRSGTFMSTPRATRPLPVTCRRRSRTTTVAWRQLHKRELVEHRRLGHVALFVGLAVFVLCVTARELLLRAFGTLPQAFDEGTHYSGLDRSMETDGDAGLRVGAARA